jgi:hypothetical protein
VAPQPVWPVKEGNSAELEARCVELALALSKARASSVEEVVEEVKVAAQLPEHEAEATNWVCLTCTYYNPGDAQDCEVCTTAKPWVCGVCTYVNVKGAVRRCKVCNSEKPDQQ